MEWLNLFGAGATILMGFFGLFLPKIAAKFVGLSANTNAGRSEFRATYGGLWVPLGLVPLLTQEPLAFLIAGLCWLGTGLGRIISIFLDKASDGKNWAAVAFEGGFAVLLLIGEPVLLLQSYFA